MGNTTTRLITSWSRSACDQELTSIGQGSDQDLVMMTFPVRLKKARKPNQPRLRFDLEKLRDPDVACTFQATIGGKFSSLIG